jgi:cyanate lyase
MAQRRGAAGATDEFKMDRQREADPKGDRIGIIMSGKFLPYKTY